MRQGWKPLALGAALAMGLIAASPPGETRAASSGEARKTSTAASAARPKNALRQFTGIVTALDKNTLTVEKRGKKPQSRVFTRHAELKTTGDLEKDARVTVFYRDEGKQIVAHRVVVRPQPGSTPSDR